MGTVTMAMERGPLMLRLSPRPMPGMDMVVCMATDTQSTAMVMVFMESGLLKPSQRPSLTTPTDTLRTAIMAMERGPLMLSQRQRPSHTTPTDPPPMATMATERGLQRPHQSQALLRLWLWISCLWILLGLNFIKQAAILTSDNSSFLSKPIEV